jgi:hypothetical protein
MFKKIKKMLYKKYIFYFFMTRPDGLIQHWNIEIDVFLFAALKF